MSERLCCIDRLDGIEVRSPFNKILALGYYDGVTEGLAQCGVCGTTFSFTMAEWDAGQDLRAYEFAERIGGALDQVVLALWPAGDSPRWPTWVPPPPFAPSAEELIKEVLAKPVGARIVLITEDPAVNIVRWHKLEPGESAPSQGWLSPPTTG